MDTGILVWAFSAGMVATVNPCGFAMLPAFVAYYLGGGQAAVESDGQRLWRALQVSLALAAGFVLLFAVVGGVIALGGRAVIRAMPWLGLTVGVGLVALGLAMLKGWEPWQRIVGYLPTVRAPRGRSVGDVFLFGLAYGVASLSCTLPVFLVVVGSAVTAAGAAGGLAQFTSYGLGMASVLTAVTLGATFFHDAVARFLRQLLPYMHQVSAVFVTLAGGYLIYYWLVKGGLSASLGF